MHTVNTTQSQDDESHTNDNDKQQQIDRLMKELESKQCTIETLESQTNSMVFVHDRSH